MKEGRLLGFLARNLAIGTAVAVGTVGGIVASDAHGIRGLLMNDSEPLVALLLLTFGFVVTLGSAAMGAAIMSLPRADDEAGRGGRIVPLATEPRRAFALVRSQGRRART